MLRFWASKLHFWRESRRKASFSSFKASFLKEVSQKCFVLELQSFNFEGSLAEKLRFWASKLQFWRKSRRNASFLSFKASIWKDVSQKRFVFELHSFNFEGSLAEMLRFWVSKLHFWRRSRRKASFDKILWITHQLTTKSLEPQIIWHPNHLNLIINWQQTFWQPNHLNLRSIDNRITWISNQLTTTSLEVQINRQPKSFEAHIDWQPNHLNLKSIDNQISWISNRLTTKSLESQINWQPNHLNLNQLTTTSLEVQINRQPKSFEANIGWQPNHLNLKSIDNQINWISNQMTTKSFDSQLVWIWHQLTFEPIELRTLPSYRFLIFGNLCGRYVITLYIYI